MKIDFFIIGAPKSGTTSLHYYLSQSNEIVGQKHMECIFFHDDSEFEKGVEFLRNKYFFDQKKQSMEGKKVLIKHSSAFYFQQEIIRSHDSNPDIKFILILRNPVERFISSYLMEVERSGYKTQVNDAIKKSIEDEVSFEYRAFNRYGQYDVLLRNLLKIIPREKLHILTYEDLVNNPISTINTLNKELKIMNNNFGFSESQTVKNGFKKAKSSTLIKAMSFLKKQRVFTFVKNKLSPKYVLIGNKFLDSYLYKKTTEKPKFSSDIYDILYNHYSNHIIEFESLSGIKTNWLENKPISTNE